MPELPEVETTRRSLEPGLLGRTIVHVTVRDRRLRWPVPDDLERALTGAVVLGIRRRAKYLLIETDRGTVMVHLGMSGSLTLNPPLVPPAKHDHVEALLDTGWTLRLHDPRRFGSVHWITGDERSHALLRELAPEPLDPDFDGDYLHRITRGRSAAIKQILMNGHLVTGVGNIYASEALHAAAIHPGTPGRRLSLRRCETLANAVKQTLARAIEAGGSSLRDYVNGTGTPGYFQLQSAVYGRAGQPCLRCGGTIRLVRHGMRATYYCAACQH
ncbi:MAG: bifunctional DNA-formamidopyrimidine glycosylase/DNA-(apurinic or apyrimidinic site) lyase [Betaproteobacteria bacterium]|nr:bifunctional DNA-formamidopyrimidine glycosylase/DNA-(apurinic or apyrimidinic site) lyase [Betaproteobacteria bacterium]